MQRQSRNAQIFVRFRSSDFFAGPPADAGGIDQEFEDFERRQIADVPHRLQHDLNVDDVICALKVNCDFQFPLVRVTQTWTLTNSEAL